MKITINRILYATDLSKNSAFAYQYATDLADKYGATIYILHVFEEWGSTVRAAAEPYLTEEQREKIAQQKPDTIEKIKERLNVFCDKVQSDDPACVMRVANIDVSEGLAAEVIIEKADEYDCDVIVMGTHEKGFIQHAFLGSVAEKVLRHSKKPVITVPLPKKENELSVHEI